MCVLATTKVSVFQSVVAVAAVANRELLGDDDQRDVILHQSVQGFLFGAVGTNETFHNDNAALLNFHSYFLINANLSFLKKIAHPSMTYFPSEKIWCRLLLIY